MGIACLLLVRDLLGEEHFQLQDRVSGQRSERESASLHGAWNSSVDTYLSQEGSCRASQLRDIKVPVNLAQQWCTGLVSN